MTLKNERELLSTRTKLAWLEARYDAICKETGPGEHVRELTMESFRRVMKQFKEEIARYEAHKNQPAQIEQK